jgi:sec-independent protein translocase protein TatA
MSASDNKVSARSGTACDGVSSSSLFSGEVTMGIGFRELLIILVIALVIFGAKRLKTIGSDLGGAVKGFKKAMAEEEDDENKRLNAPGEKDADFDSTPAKARDKAPHV